MRPTTLALLSAAVLSAATLSLPAAGAAPAPAAGNPSRNAVSAERNLPETVEVPKAEDDKGEIDVTKAKNVAWAARLGSHAYGNPVVAGGKVYVGTNNHRPRDAKYDGDRGVLLCLDEKTGKMLWQLVVPKLAGGRNVDYEDCGICSAPAVDGDRLYLLTNRCELVCLDVNGLADGNAGVTDEAAHAGGPGAPPIPQGPTDADVVWRYDMRHELGVFPHYMTAGTPLVVGDKVYAVTSNGVDWSDGHVPAPAAPVLICLDKKTGKLLGQERAGISARTFYCNWSNPAFGTVGGKPTVVIGGGDGFAYGFDPQPTPDGTLRELWRIDCNPPEYRAKDGKPVKYGEDKGPSEVIATPVIFDGKVYVGVGQDPEHGRGAGAMNCIEVGPGGTKLAWQNKNVERTMSAVAIVGGLLYVPDIGGVVHCLDAATGKAVWRHDVESNVWGSALAADGRLYLGNESSELVILAAGKEKREIGKFDLRAPISGTPVAANGALYVATDTQLFKIVK